MQCSIQSKAIFSQQGVRSLDLEKHGRTSSINKRLACRTLHPYEKALFGSIAAFSISWQPAIATSIDVRTPYQQGKTLEYGLDQFGRIRACNAAANPSCISTSSKTDLYSPPWLAQAASPQFALEDFDAALLGISRKAKVLDDSIQYISNQSTDSTDIGNRIDTSIAANELRIASLYRRYAIPTIGTDMDIVEVLISGERSEDDPNSYMVTYKSQANQVRYIWPITQPISDFGESQRNRMKLLRKRLGWRILGGQCDMIECFSES